MIVAAGPDADLCCGDKTADGLRNCEELHIGDRVLYGQFSGTLVQFKGKPSYTILGADEILAKVVSEDTLDYTASG